MTEEQYLIERIQILQNVYQKSAQPYFERLAKIRAYSTIPPILVEIDSLPLSVRESIYRQNGEQA